MENKQTAFSFTNRVKSIGYAIHGVQSFLKTEHNAIIHLCCTVFVVLAAIFFDISLTEWLAMIVVIGMVWAAELFNTVIELMMDHLSAQIHPKVKIIKDISAAAVLTTAITAWIVGMIIFLPKLL